MEQVANAVPAPVATAIPEEARRSLMRTDTTHRGGPEIDRRGWATGEDWSIDCRSGVFAVSAGFQMLAPNSVISVVYT